LASDLSHIIKEDIASTLDSLLSVSTSISSTKKADGDNIGSEQCICIDINFEFSNIGSSKWSFYIPTQLATKFEFQMLGGIGDLKEAIDDEILDAVNEIVSNICGSISTNINAQSFDDIGSAKFTVENSAIVECDSQSSENVFQFDLTLNDEVFTLFIKFESIFFPFISLITTGVESSPTHDLPVAGTDISSNHGILSLLGDEAVDNLKLLFDIKFKLSVRLGTKILLLKDILSWDTGTIIELEQMVNEPLDILVNGVKVGEGEAVIVEGRFGVKIKTIGTKKIN
jgi:flagellar motor switch protein FliN/FliY